MRALTWIVVALLVLLGAAFGARWWANNYMAQRAMTPKALGAETPATQGLQFSRVAVASDDRTLIGWWVRAKNDSGKAAPALLFLHGNRSSISDYVAVQKFLARQGVSSFVFDYSGFGASGGSASLRNAVVDATNAARAFADSAGKTARRIAMGSALGATVLLQAIDSVEPYVNGVVIEGVPASVRESAVRDGRVPAWAARFLDDPGDNVAAARRVKVPMLVVQSVADARTPVEEAQRVANAATTRTVLVRHPRKGHSALLASSRPCDWAQVLNFVRTGALPATKIDTTDVCEADRQAAELALRDGVARAVAESTLKVINAQKAKEAAKKAPSKVAPTKKRTNPPKSRTAPARAQSSRPQ